MLKNVTLDSVLRDYYHSIHSEKLSEDNITIDDGLEDPVSSAKYIINFATFLNDAYYKGYALSPSILKKLMDVIDYTGYENQIIECYINILNGSMIDHKIQLECTPDFDKLVLTTENCRAFITKYLEAVQDIDIISKTVVNTKIPHFKDPIIEEPVFDLYILKEVYDPIELIHKDIMNKGIHEFKKIVDILYTFYNIDREAFANLFNKYLNSEALFFLLDEEDYDSIDICIDNIKTFNDLAKYIKAYYHYSDTVEFTEIMAKNIKRIIDILTINITKEQLAMIIGTEYEFWKLVCENLNNPWKLYDAVSLYKRFPDQYTADGPVQLIYKINNYFGDDIYFFARHILLNMDYKLFCENFINIFTELLKYLTKQECMTLAKDCVFGLVNLREKVVDDELIKLHDHLMQRGYCTEKDSNILTIKDNKFNTLFMTDNLKLDDDMFEVTSYTCARICSRLLIRNGVFDESWANSKDYKSPNYHTICCGKSLNGNYIYGNPGSYTIETGSVFSNVRHIEIVNPNINIRDLHLDENFKYCEDKEFASYIVKYTEAIFEPCELLLILGDDNHKVKFINPGISKSEKDIVILGLYDVSNSKFIYGNIIYDDSVPEKLYKYSQQICTNISMESKYMIDRIRQNIYTYYVSEAKYANELIEISIDFNKDLNRSNFIIGLLDSEE